MSALRKFTVGQSSEGFWSGFSRGLASSVEVFDTPVQRLAGQFESGLKLDVEALRADVGRARNRIAREIEKSIRDAKAS